MENHPLPLTAPPPGLEKPSPSSWLRAGAGQAWKSLTLAVALGLAAGMALIAQAAILANIMQQVLFAGRDLAAVTPLMLLLPPLMLLRAGLVWTGEQMGFQAAATVKTSLRIQLYDHVQALGPDRLRSASSGDLAHHVVDGVEGLEAYYARFLPQLANAALIPAAILAFVFPADLISGLILLFTAPFIPLFMILIGSRARRMNQRQWRRLARLSARFLDSLQGLTTLKLFNATRREADLIARITDNYRRTTVSVLRVAFISALVLEFFSTVSLAVVAVFIGFKLLAGNMAFESGFFILLLAPEFFLPLRALGSSYHARLSAMAAAEGLLSLLADPPPPRAGQGAVRPVWTSLCLDVDQVCYRHTPDAPLVLDAISLHVPAGACAVLTGASGAGKTTLLRLLLGTVRPVNGCILANGLDVSGLDLEAWLRHVAWMPQTPGLFQATLLDNVLMENQARISTAEMSELNRMARVTGLDRDLAGLGPMEQAWHTRLGEDGLGLSGGQRQRVALTRAALKKAPLMLLDEPTAHLDRTSHATMLAALRSWKGRHTMVIASHDPEIRELADIVLELQTKGQAA